MTDHCTYILVGQTPVAEPDRMKWVEWRRTADRQVALTVVGPYEVSTVFLGLDSSWPGPPMLFESMIFPREKPTVDHMHDDFERQSEAIARKLDPDLLWHQVRWETWSEAEEGHLRMIELVRSKLAETN